MVRTVAPALVVAAWLSSVVRADLPLPPNIHYVQPVVQFEGIDKHPDYVFQLRFTSFTGGPTGSYKNVNVSSAKPFTLVVERRLMDMHLLAMKRDAFQQRPPVRTSSDALTEKTDGVSAAEVDAPSTTGPKDKPVPVTKYRVELREGKLTVQRIPPTDERQGAVTAPWGTWVSGLAMASACVGLGLAAIHWSRFRRPRPTSGTAPAA